MYRDWRRHGALAACAALVAAVALGPARCDAQPSPLTEDFQVNTFTTEGQNSSAVGVDGDGNFVVTWVSEDNVSVGAEGQDGDLAGIFAQRFDAAANPVGPEFQVNTTTAGAQYSPDILVDGASNFTIAWESPDGSGDGVFARTYFTGGTPLGDEFQVNAYSTFDQREVRLTVVDGGFVAVWTNDGTAQTSVRRAQFDSGTGMFVFDAEKSIAGSGRTALPDVDSADDSSFVVVYQDLDDPGVFSAGIGAQRFDAAGDPLGTTFRVNSHTTGAQVSPAVSVGADGTFVIAWIDATASEVKLRRYASNGSPAADAITVGVADGTGGVRFPDVVLDGDGTMLVIWETFNELSPGGDFSASGVAGQLVSAGGALLGTKFRVNEDVVSSQRNPALGADRDGRYVVSWDQSSGQDGDQDSVEARLFGPAATTCGDLTGDGVVAATDALAALSAATGTGSCDPCLCDVDDNGSITATDALVILKAAVGHDVTLNCPAC
jgi:hypothetical protein